MSPSPEDNSKTGAKNMTSALVPEDKEPKTPIHANPTSNTLVPTIIPDNSGIFLAQDQASVRTGGEQSVGTVAEDKYQTVSVSSTSDDPTTAADTAGFPMFQTLPAEIRNMVWELAAIDHRHDPSRLVFLYNCRKFECPTVLRVNQEANTAAAGYFKKLKKFKPVREGNFNGTLATKILVNPERDIVTYLNPNRGSHFAPFKRLIYQCAAEGVQYLALSSNWVFIFLEDGFIMGAIDSLMKGGNLKGLFVVRKETLHAGEDNVQLVGSNTLADWLYKDSIEAELEESGERRGWEWDGQLEIVCLEAIPSA